MQRDRHGHPETWHAGRYGNTKYEVVGRGRSLAIVSGDDGMGIAHLMAAAPELLAVVEGCLGYFESMGKNHSDFTPDAAWLADLRSVIAKANGEDR